MDILLKGLLSISRLGRMQLDVKSINMNSLLSEVAMNYQYQITENSVELYIDKLPDCTGDIHLMNQVFSNLIENALRHTQVDGTIILGVTAVDNQHGWVVSVEDNGDGIPEDDIPYVFDARFRANNATEGKNENRGLGLAITRKLLDVLGTDIKVKSALGEGTRFSFILE